MAVEDNLIDDLRRVGEELGKTPTANEYDERGDWSSQTLSNYFGSWNEAVEEAGFEPNVRGAPPRSSDEEILEDIRRVAHEVGSPPSKREYGEHGEYSEGLPARRFGSWNTAIQEAGLEPEHTAVTPVETSSIIEDLQRVAEELGQTPTVNEYKQEGEFSHNTVENRFGTWNEALEAADLEVIQRRGAPDDDLLADLQRVANRTGSPPTAEDYAEFGEWSTQTLANRFGSWNEALEAAGFQPRRRRGIPDEDVIDDIQQVADTLQEPPTMSEYREQGNFSAQLAGDRFGSWNEALEAAGLTPQSRQDISDKELLEDIQRVADLLGNPPTGDEYRERGKYSPQTAAARFGGWPDSLREAGLTPTQEGSKQIPDIRVKGDLQRVGRELGHPPSQSEYLEMGNYSINTVASRFGGWTEALQEVEFGGQGTDRGQLNLSTIGVGHVVGGAAGVGVPFALRRTLDDNSQPVYARPSVLWGVGGGALTALLWYAGIGPKWTQSVFAAHSATAIPTGVASALVYQRG